MAINDIHRLLAFAVAINCMRGKGLGGGAWEVPKKETPVTRGPMVRPRRPSPFILSQKEKQRPAWGWQRARAGRRGAQAISFDHVAVQDRHLRHSPQVCMPSVVRSLRRGRGVEHVGAAARRMLRPKAKQEKGRRGRQGDEGQG